MTIPQHMQLGRILVKLNMTPEDNQWCINYSGFSETVQEYFHVQGSLPADIQTMIEEATFSSHSEICEHQSIVVYPIYADMHYRVCNDETLPATRGCVIFFIVEPIYRFLCLATSWKKTSLDTASGWVHNGMI